MAKTKLKSYKHYKTKLDTVFSQYIRRRDSDQFGQIKCITCSKVLPWEDSQNCHYVSRNNLATRWHEKNCHAGCVGCNVFGGGRLDDYAISLLNKYGQGILEELSTTKRASVKFSRTDLIEKIEYYSNIIQQMI